MPRASPSSQCGLAGEVERWLFAPDFFFAVAVFVLADGNAVVGQVGQRLQDLAQTFVGRPCRRLERLHLSFKDAGLFGLGGCVCALAAELRDLFRQFVSLGLQGLNLCNGLSTFPVYSGEVAKSGGRIHATRTQFFFDKGQIAPYKR